MRDLLPPPDLLLGFDAAARHLSFTKAAAERFVTQSAISRQVAQLEAQLGVPLFERRHRALALTPAGAALAGTVAKALAELRATVAQVRAQPQRQQLALSTTPGLASLWLIPRLAEFLAAHPGIDVRIDATFERRDFVRDGIDLVIRYAVAVPDGEPLFAESLQPVCAPALLRGPHPLRTPADLRQHTLLQVAMPMGAPEMPQEWQSWLAAAGVAALEPKAVLSFSAYNDAVAAAVAGQGVLLGKRPLVDATIDAGALVTPFAGRTAGPRGYFVIVAPGSATRPAVQALKAWLLATVKAPAPAAAPPTSPAARRGPARRTAPAPRPARRAAR